MTGSRALFSSLLASGSQDATGGKAADDRVPGVLLLAEVHQSAVDGREHASPDGKVSTDDGRPFFYGDDAAQSSPLESLQARID